MDEHDDSTGDGEKTEDKISHDRHSDDEREQSKQGREVSHVERSLLEEEARDTEKPERETHNRHKDGDRDHGGHGGMHAGHEQMFRRRFFVSTLLSIPVLLYSEALQQWLGFSVPAFPGSEWINPVFAIIVFAYGGVPFLKMALPELQDRSPGMMTLISMAITVAFVYSLASVVLPTTSAFFWELVTLIDIMLLGHWIEMRSVRRASGALNELAKLLPDTAERILDDGTTEEVPVSDLQTDDRVLVRPGANVPADGVVAEGHSEVNESMITGESRPVLKESGDEVIGGTINGDGSLRVQITATGDDTALAGIMRLVEEAQQSKSRTQVLADRAAGWLFYAAVAAAIITAIGWTIAISFNAMVIERVVTVLVIACPHALGLAVPLVVAINTSLAARNGMLVRDRIAMEQAREVDIVVFDKTGTLTKGEQGVVDVMTVSGINDDEAVAMAAAVERDSEHMIAQALRDAAANQGLSVPQASNFEAIKGRGVRATIDDDLVFVGGPNLIEQEAIELAPELTQFANTAGENAQTVVYLLRDNEAIAAFALADVIREESRQTIEALHELDIEVAMLTGDSEGVARAVADDLGIDTYFAEVLPEDKDSKITTLQEQGKLVAMVGDGVNDAPALTRADIGIAIGSGTDVAVQSADLILVQNNPLDVVRLVKLSRASYRKMQENLVWAAGYNVFAIPLAAGILAPIGILLSPAVGALLMSLSTVVVAVNAQFLRRVDLDLPNLPGLPLSQEPQSAD
ncbi:copper-translocating P-type ATPase [Haladaptatus sp. DYF46]|uniref:copper-translocating P-type ATPase n=1 Tax=Haladaptatus sp. DYF46 TaxID=2886041 RepID=UPI001E4A0A7C|nr:copper-translocating P-type ATPase [Haladaptatus sp. DYF46]